MGYRSLENQTDLSDIQMTFDLRTQINHSSFGQVKFSDGHCIKKIAKVVA
jgi:hypothetical protein